MNAISGPSQSLAAGALFTNAPVGRVRRVPSQAERIELPGDRWEPSSQRESLPSVTYSRTGAGGCGKT